MIFRQEQMQLRDEIAVWHGCESVAVTRYPPDDGVFRKATTRYKIGASIRECFASHGYYFHGNGPCGPNFPSRFEAPFCYAPMDGYDRMLFSIRQLFVEE